MKVAIIAPGEMGSGVGARLRSRGAEVYTSLKGRGGQSAERAQRAGMLPVADDLELVTMCDILLSILPPAEAVGLARRLSPALAQAGSRVLYADCNAVAPQTVQRVADIVAGAGARFVDVGIIGGPPRPEGYTPHLYASGDEVDRFRALGDFGLEIRPVAGGIGAASALKMSYAALTKGLSALGIAVARGADYGVVDALRAEYAQSQPQLYAWLQRQIPSIYPKAYRWVGEMEEIARFLGDDPTAQIYLGAARAYEAVAARWDAKDEEGLRFLAKLFAK
jgi:L-threonate 2-dehydrogenase